MGKGMTAKVKGSRTDKYYLSDKQLEREKKKVTGDVTDLAYQLMLVSFADEVEDSIIKFDSMCKELRIGKERAEKIKAIFRFDDEMMCRVYDRTDRYARFYKQHLFKMRDAQKCLEKHTGAELKGW
jgi:hypothetical protein